MRIFDGRVEAESSAEELVELHRQAKSRYESKIPPGYKDKEKGEPDAFKDYVGWCQLIEIAKKEKKDLIFVCDDAKEDWWHIEKGRTIGPRYELVEECLNKSQQFFYMYNSETFLRYANTYLAERIKEDAIVEVSERLAAANSEIQLASALKPTAESTMSDVDQLKPDVVKEESGQSDIKPTQQDIGSKGHEA